MRASYGPHSAFPTPDSHSPTTARQSDDGLLIVDIVTLLAALAGVAAVWRGDDDRAMTFIAAAVLLYALF